MTIAEQDPRFLTQEHANGVYEEPDPVRVLPIVGADGLPIIDGQSVIDSVAKFCNFDPTESWSATEVKVVYPDVPISSRVEKKLSKAIDKYGEDNVLELLKTKVNGRILMAAEDLEKGGASRRSSLARRRLAAGAKAKGYTPESLRESAGEVQIFQSNTSEEDQTSTEPKLHVWRILGAAAVIAGIFAYMINGSGEDNSGELVGSMLKDKTVPSTTLPNTATPLTIPKLVNETTTTTQVQIEASTSTTAKVAEDQVEAIPVSPPTTAEPVYPFDLKLTSGIFDGLLLKELPAAVAAKTGDNHTWETIGVFNKDNEAFQNWPIDVPMQGVKILYYDCPNEVSELITPGYAPSVFARDHEITMHRLNQINGGKTPNLLGTCARFELSQTEGN